MAKDSLLTTLTLHVLAGAVKVLQFNFLNLENGSARK